MGNINFLDILSLISLTLGILSTVITLRSTIFNYLKQNKTLEEIDEELFKLALTSSDIRQLGKYLDKNIGNVSIKEFSSNIKIQKKVNQYIQGITDFIGTEASMKKEEVKKEDIQSNERKFSYNYYSPKEFFPIIEELRFGQPWNALAQLRRHIEISLKDFFMQYKLDIKENLPISQMVSILSTTEVLTNSSIRELKYSIAICNKAIHGTDVSIQEAEEAINLAIGVLEEIKKHTKKY